MRTLVPFLLAACVGAPASPPKADPTPATGGVDRVDSDVPSPPPIPLGARYAATHLVVAYAGAVGAPADVTRSRDEARALAAALRGRAIAGEPLERLARESSDDPSGPRGGRLGILAAGLADPAFEQAVGAVPPGAIAPLAETARGFHVVRRDAVVSVELRHLQVAYGGAAGRTRADALARIALAADEIAAGDLFPEVAARFDDAPDTSGEPGAIHEVGRYQLAPPLDRAAFALAPGQVSAPVDSGSAWHLIARP
jgi:hypothetical protein